MAEKTLESLGLKMAAGPLEKLNATAGAFFYDLSALTPQEQVGFSLEEDREGCLLVVSPGGFAPENPALLQHSHSAERGKWD